MVQKFCLARARHANAPITPAFSGGHQCSVQRQNKTGLNSGENGYITPAAWVFPNAQHGDKLRNGPNLALETALPKEIQISPENPQT